MSIIRWSQITVFSATLLSAAQASILVLPSNFDFSMIDSDFPFTSGNATFQPNALIALGSTTVFPNSTPAFFEDIQVTSSETVISASRSIVSVRVETLPNTSPVDPSPGFLVDGAAAETIGGQELSSYTPVIGTISGSQGILFNDDIVSLNSATIRYFVDGTPIFSGPSSIVGAVNVLGDELKLAFFTFNLRLPYVGSGSNLAIDDADELLLEFDVTIVPEPGNFVLMFAALGLMAALGRRRRG